MAFAMTKSFTVLVSGDVACVSVHATRVVVESNLRDVADGTLYVDQEAHRRVVVVINVDVSKK